MSVNVEFLNTIDFKGSTTKETTKETTEETKSVVEQIVALMKESPKITVKQIADQIENITTDGIRYHIKNLKAHGRVARKGSTKAGEWIVIK